MRGFALGLFVSAALTLGGGSIGAGVASAQAVAPGIDCGETSHALFIHAANITCKRAKQVANYWETKGRGHCPKGWKFKDLGPAPIDAPGGSLLSCHRQGAPTYVASWVEGGE